MRVKKLIKDPESVNSSSVLLLTSEFPPQPGGIGAHAHHVAKHLTLNSFVVTVLTDMRSPLGVAEQVFDAKQLYSVIRVKRKRLLFITYLQRLQKAFQKAKEHDVILVSGKFSIWLGGILSVFFSTKTVAVIHGSEVNVPSRLKRSYTKWCLKRFQTVVAVSNYTKSLLSAWHLREVIVIPNGYEIVTHKMGENRTHRKLRLITVGNVTQRKGQHNVVKALPEILKIFPTTTYDVVGIPTEKENLLALSEQLGVADAVIFHGMVSEEKKVQLLEKATIFIMLSENTSAGDVEGFGIAILEANALGIPAIGAINCGIEDAIKNHHSGILVSAKSTEDIVRAISAILQEYDHYKEHAKSWASEFRWEHIIKEYCKLLTE